MISPFVRVVAVALVVGACSQIPFAAAMSGLLASSYREGESVPVTVNAMTSQTKLLPMPWYSYPWCPLPDDMLVTPVRKQNLGQALRGDKVMVSLMTMEMAVNKTCQVLCEVALDKEKRALITQRIEDKYRGQMLLDALPVGEEGSGARSRFSNIVSMGFPLGIPRKRSGVGRTIIYNHLDFSVFYRDSDGMLDEDDMYRVVGFQVRPMSIEYVDGESSRTCGPEFVPSTANPVLVTDESVVWTYSVKWYESEVEWAHRWDVYVRTSPRETRIHWFGISNSIIVILVLTGSIGYIMVRALRRDLARYNDPESIQEERDESGWKLVHDNVFRKPEAAGLLAVCVGSGLQLAGTVFATVLVALMGYLAPGNPGALVTAIILMFVLMGFVNGYVTARLAKFFSMRSWKIVFLGAGFVPAQMFSMYFMLNLVHWQSGATSATPISSMATLVGLWLLVALPLALLGGGVGYRADTITIPCKASSIPRTIPPLPWFLRFPATAILPGFVPFGVAFIESIFILGSVWQGRVYHVFGFLALMFVVVLLTSAEATVVLVYVQLVHLEYRWWWHSFVAAGSYGGWLFAYSMLYYVTSLSIRSWWSSCLYFGYMFMASYACFFMLGAFGFIMTWLFVRAIYGAVKID